MEISSSEFKELIIAMVMVAFSVFLGLLVPQTVGLGAGGFDSTNVLQQFTFYTPVLIGSMIIILLCIVLVMYLSKESEYGDGVMFVSQGEYPAVPYFKKYSSIRLGWLSLIIFLTIGLWIVRTGQKSFTGLRVLEHQFTPVSSIIYSTFLIPFSENGGAAAVLAIFILTLVILSKKYNIYKGNYKYLIYFFVPVLIGIYGLVNHLLRYKSDQYSLVVVFVFWYIGGLITVITGNWIPFIIMHGTNNFIYDSRRLFDSDKLFYYLVFFVIVLSISYVYVYYIKKPKENKLIT